jgi:hypothetical protein
VVNNLYSLKRDRDSRLRNFRDQHYSQLKPVLRTEATKLQEIADQIQKTAHITSVAQFEGTPTDPADRLWPDVLSRDLADHFADYDASKRLLLSQIEAQDREYKDTAALAETKIHFPGVEPYWREVDAVSYVQKC